MFVLSFQEAHRVKNFCDCCNHHRSRAGHCGRASNLASFVARNVCRGNLSSCLLLSWCLSWTCCCHLYCVYRRCCLCTGKILVPNFKTFFLEKETGTIKRKKGRKHRLWIKIYSHVYCSLGVFHELDVAI